MKVYRYNAKQRSDRRFNNTGREKNPNAVKFYAKSLEAAKKYEAIYNKKGEVLYYAELEIVDLEDDIKLFDMVKFYATTKAYKAFISKEINQQLSDYTSFLLNAKTKKDKKLWQKAIDDLKNREQELIKNLYANDFQQLSDFENQNVLLEELKAEGFDGYFTNNEIALF